MQRFLKALLIGLLSTPLAWAQATNGTYTLSQEMVTSTGGTIGGGNPMKAQTSLGLFAGGMASNTAFTLVGGFGASQTPSAPPVTATITVTGTVDDPAATVTVNGMPATVSGTSFSAANIMLTAGPNTITTVATDQVGNQASKTVTTYLDLPAAQKTPRFSINVSGTASDNDQLTTVSVNGVAATLSAGQFTASVPLVSGLNTLTATARDRAGTEITKSVRVFVPQPTSFPAMPTVGTIGTPPPAVTTQSSVTIGGTKAAGASIWINGQQVYTADDGTSWTATITLVEGDNRLAIVAKDANGVSSAAATVNIIKDTLPPVITMAGSVKTNLNPFPLTGTVDDSLTQVKVSGIVGTNIGGVFTVTLPLTSGTSTFTLTATSPNGYVSTKSVSITLGTVPTIQAAQPVDGSKLTVGAPVTLQISATDAESDSLQYQVSVDGTPLADWANSLSAWTPSSAHTGLHTLTAHVRDGYGGAGTKEIEVFVVRSPIQHP